MKNFKKLVSIAFVLLLVITIMIPATSANAAKATKTTKTTKITKTSVKTVKTKITKVSKIKISRKSATLYVGKTITLNISGKKKNVSWSSSNTEVATVASKGKVKAKSIGTTNITATVGDKVYTCKVTVKAKKSPYKLNESWKVAGQWDFKFTSAVTSLERNSTSTITPAQVVVLTYDFENLGFMVDGKNLNFSAATMKVIDEYGVVAQSYPITVNAPLETAIGAKFIGAQEAFALQNISNKVTVLIEAYDGNGILQKVKFALPIAN